MNNRQNQITFDVLKTGHTPQLARLHIEEIKTGFISSLGVDFVTALYESIAEDKNSFGFVAIEDDNVLGFAAFSNSLSRLYKYVALRKGFKFALILVRKMFSLKVFKKVWDNIFYPSKMAKMDLPDAELLSIVVAPQGRGKGIAKQLVGAGFQECEKRGIEKVKVLVRADNEPANKLYLKCGFEFKTQTESRGIKSNIYVADLRENAMSTKSNFKQSSNVFFENKFLGERDRCTHCVLSQSLQTITFSEDGVCSLCSSAKQNTEKSCKTEKSEEKLNEIIEGIRARGKGSDYDCLIGLSGGQDSTYLLYLLTQKHKLRTLAAYYRTPFTHDVIDRNVRRIVKQLDVKLVEINISWDLHLEVAKKYFLLWQKKPLPEIANLTCVVCKLVNREVFRIARAYDIKSIVCGGNKYEELQILPAFRDEDLTDKAHSFWNQFRKMLQTFKKGISLLSKCPSVIRYLPISVKVSLLYITLHTPYLRLRYRDIYCVDYFFHTEWNETDCVKTIQSKLGWELPPGCLGTWKADCDFADIKNYMFYKATGATYAETMLSNLIRDGQITREEALKRLGKSSGVSWVKIKRALDKMGLSAPDVQTFTK